MGEIEVVWKWHPICVQYCLKVPKKEFAFRPVKSTRKSLCPRVQWLVHIWERKWVNWRHSCVLSFWLVRSPVSTSYNVDADFVWPWCTGLAVATGQQSDWRDWSLFFKRRRLCYFRWSCHIDHVSHTQPRLSIRCVHNWEHDIHNNLA